MNILTPAEIEKYREHLEYSRRAGRSAFFAGVDDVQRMLDEITSSRLQIEQHAEKIAQLRESLPLNK